MFPSRRFNLQTSTPTLSEIPGDRKKRRTHPLRRDRESRFRFSIAPVDLLDSPILLVAVDDVSFFGSSKMGSSSFDFRILSAGDENEDRVLAENQKTKTPCQQPTMTQGHLPDPCVLKSSWLDEPRFSPRHCMISFRCDGSPLVLMLFSSDSSDAAASVTLMMTLITVFDQYFDQSL